VCGWLAPLQDRDASVEAATGMERQVLELLQAEHKGVQLSDEDFDAKIAALRRVSGLPHHNMPPKHAESRDKGQTTADVCVCTCVHLQSGPGSLRKQFQIRRLLSALKPGAPMQAFDDVRRVVDMCGPWCCESVGCFLSNHVYFSDSLGRNTGGKKVATAFQRGTSGWCHSVTLRSRCCSDQVCCSTIFFCFCAHAHLHNARTRTCFVSTHTPEFHVVVHPPNALVGIV